MRTMTLVLIALLAAVGGLAAGAHATTHAANPPSGLDEEWLKTSAQGDVFEINGGKIALRKSHNAAVRKLARTLVSDHTKSLSDAKKVASKYGISLETTPTPSEQWELQVVSTMRGKAFNRWYSSLEVKDHQQDIQETSAERDKGSNPDIRSQAIQDLPMLDKHLSLAKAALRSA